MIIDSLEIAFRTIDVEIAALNFLKKNLDKEFEMSVETILKANGKIVVTGIGKSGIVGQKIAATLASTGTPSFFIHPAEAFHGDLGMIEVNDIIIAISHSGETDEVLRLIPFFRENNNTIISMTGNAASTLGKNSNFHLSIAVEKEACPLELAPTSSTTATMVMGDALAIALMEKRAFRKEHFARLHPGGSLGRKLLTTAQDVMKSENLPIVNPSTPMIDIIHAITRGRLGIAIVCDGDHIVGIITDGDMRRIFEGKMEKSFLLKASDFMTRNPKTASINTKLIEAQEVMNKFKINSLLVTSKGELSELIGVVQLYDIK